jgi:hypothetical protein
MSTKNPYPGLLVLEDPELLSEVLTIWNHESWRGVPDPVMLQDVFESILSDGIRVRNRELRLAD